MIYLWGKTSRVILNAKIMEEIYLEASQKISHFSEIPIEEILDILHLTGQSWIKGKGYYEEALTELKNELSFSPSMIELALAIIPTLLNKENLRLRLESEFGQLTLLDKKENSHRFLGSLKVSPMGIVTHVTAGNVFLGFLDSLIMGLITKNISIVKLSQGNQSFPPIFMKSLIKADKKKILTPYFSLLTWKGGDKNLEKVMKEKSHLIMAWGGEGMLDSLKKDLPNQTKLLDFGPKVSIQLISKSGHSLYSTSEIAKNIVQDIYVWDQAACASPQNLFIEQGIPVKELMNQIKIEFEKIKIPLGSIDQDEQVEILKEKHRGIVSKAKHNGDYIQGKDFLVHYDKLRGLRNSPLNRTLIIKNFKSSEDLKEQLAPYHFYMQSVSLLIHPQEKQEYEKLLSIVGAKRIAPLGTIMNGTNGAPHDHRFVLNELVRFTPWEKTHSLLDLAIEAFASQSFYKKKYKDVPQDFNKIPLLDSKDLITFKPNSPFGGHIFASGGTTGKPKYSFYSEEEFLLVAEMLGTNFRLNGIKPYMTVANLFVAGNLWSSFIAVEKALAYCQAKQLSIGGLADKEIIMQYLEEFKPDFLLGIPTLLIDLAEEFKKKKKKFKVKGIFYAGEKFPHFGLKLIEEVFQTKHIRSASYASVDAGPIGYQCSYCKAGEHHIFQDYIHLERIDGEAIVTTKYREVQPLVRLKTGDAISVFNTEICPCGSSSPRFILQGRLDDQINIWGCRLKLEELESVFMHFPDISQYQVELSQNKKEEQMLIRLEVSKTFQEKKFIEDIYHSFQDLKFTHPISYFQSKIKIELKQRGTIERVKRTGKLKKVIDKR
ncbi:MAG: acyl-CoA reductase [Bacteriovoracaceae bacterium]